MNHFSIGLGLFLNHVDRFLGIFEPPPSSLWGQFYLIWGLFSNMGSSINHVVKILGIFDPPSWSILQNKAYVIKWSFGLTPSPNCSRGLWMTPSQNFVLCYILLNCIEYIRVCQFPPYDGIETRILILW